MKLGLAAGGVTPSENSALCDSMPEVPCSVSVAVPAVTVCEAVSVMVRAVPGVNGNVDKDAVTPAGKPERFAATVALKPLIASAVTLNCCVEPAVNAIDPAGPVNAKSGWLVPVVTL